MYRCRSTLEDGSVPDVCNYHRRTNLAGPQVYVKCTSINGVTPQINTADQDDMLSHCNLSVTNLLHLQCIYVGNCTHMQEMPTP